MGNQNYARYFIWTGVVAFGVACLGSVPVSAADEVFNPFKFEPNTTYISVYGGGSILNDDDVMRPGYHEPGDNFHSISNPGFLVGGVLGVRLNEYFRTEGELSFSRWTHDYVETWLCPEEGKRCGISQDGYQRLGTGGSTNAFNFFGNAWLDVGLPWDFSVYGGGGLGFTLLAYQDKYFGVDRQDFSFAWQYGSGLRYQMTETLLIDARWVRRGPIRLDYAIYQPFEMQSDNVTFGLTYEF
jgi:opacity protein-like surface antigen